MLVAAISDTHLPRGARRLPEAVLEALRRADVIVHAGDFSSLAFLEELRALGPPVHAVHGNADEPALREMLPERLVVEVEAVTLDLGTGQTTSGTGGKGKGKQPSTCKKGKHSTKKKPCRRK